MAQTKIKACTIVNGVRKVELPGGWVRWDMLTAALKASAERAMRAAHPEWWQTWEAGEACSYRFDGDTPSESLPYGQDKQDKQDKQDNDQNDQNDDDTPVMHGVFDPWAAKVDKVALATSALAETTADNVRAMDATLDALVKDSSSQRRALDDLARRVSQGNDGTGGIVKIIIQTPTRPEPKEMGDELFHAMFPRLLKNVAAGSHVYLPGPPGSGKSHAASQVARALGWRFGAISLGPTTPESRLWGGMTATGEFFEPPMVELARHAAANPDSGAVYCLDEMDNGHAGILATLNSALANSRFTAPNGDEIEWGSNFVVVAGANTFGTGPTAEFAGRNRLDAATLDRFNYLPWDTDTAMERAIVGGTLHDNPTLAADWLDVWTTARANVAAHGLKVFVTMRGAGRGARMLACGDTISDTLNEVLLHKLPKDQAEKVSPL